MNTTRFIHWIDLSTAKLFRERPHGGVDGVGVLVAMMMIVIIVFVLSCGVGKDIDVIR